MHSTMFVKSNKRVKSVQSEIISRYIRKVRATQTHQMDDIAKAHTLFSVFLDFIQEKQWKYFPQGNNPDGSVLLNKDYTEPQLVNCVELSNAFVQLYKNKEIDIKNVCAFEIYHKAGKKLGEKFSEFSPPLLPFDLDISSFVDKEFIFKKHCVVKVGNRFYDLAFSTYYDDINAPFDNTLYGQIVSLIDAKNDDAAKNLLIANPDIDLARTFEGWTLLHRAAFSGLLETVEILINLGADTNVQSTDQFPSIPLQFMQVTCINDTESELFKKLSEKVDSSIVEKIKNEKIEFLNMEENNKKLLSAMKLVRNNNVERLERIISEGLDINSQDENGWTLLHQAVCFEKTDVVIWLILNGANTFIENDEGKIPLDLCFITESPIYHILSGDNKTFRC